ncbi:MAG: Cft2 family processing exonuclease [Verrucomicrobiales bacterium]|nr:Cft2 family processing exonuclease [Verrucomicrobiales bacterium]MDB6130213.1 Cft2 family processing exonuclease [Verrucomicrobiales bacterium]
MKIINLNPGDEIGASAWFLELEGNRLLMDAGIHPKREGKEGMPLFDLIAKEDLDAIALSHCHHDHVGSLPVALRHFPQAHVLMTELSYFLVERVLHNSVNVMTKQRDEVGIKEYPLYTHDEVDDIAPVFQGFKYNKEIEWSQLKKVQIGLPSPTLEFYDAGHALGSAGMMIRGQKQTLFYSGDVSFRDQTILRGARFEDVKADVLILETTRGNREVAADFTREKEVERLAASIQKVLARKGSVLIPTFALGRTQEILAQLALLMKENKIPRQPIYIGGLGRVFTEIYDLQAHRTHRQLTNLKLTEALHLIVLDKNKAEQMKLGGGKLFVITAGMMSEQTAAHDLAMRMVGDPNQAVFFVGYADSETPGGRLKKAKDGETFVFSASGGELTRSCQVEEFDLTAHANRDELVDFVGQVAPHTVILGHGEPDARQWIENQIKLKYPKMKVFQPKPGEAITC